MVYMVKLFMLNLNNTKVMIPKHLTGILLLTCLWASGCCKENCNPPVVPPDYSKTKLEIVWLNFFYPDSTGYVYTDPIFCGDYIIYASTNSGNNNRTGIRVWHKQTGANHPAWQQMPGLVVDQNQRLDDIHLGGLNNSTLFIAGTPRTVYAVDLMSGQRLWKSTLPNNYADRIYFAMLGNTPIKAYSSSSQGWSRYAKLDLATGNRTDILQTECGLNTMNYINLLPVWTINGGDTLLLFLSGGWNTNTVRGYTTAYCYNVTQKRVEWTRNEDEIFENEGGYIGLRHPIVIENNKVLFQCVRSFFCFDIATGNLVWKYIPVPMNSFTETPVLYDNGKLYLRCDEGRISCLDAQTGYKLWSVRGDYNYGEYFPAPHGKMDIYKGRLYFAGWGPDVTFWLYCLDANTGQLLWKDRGPTQSISHGVLIDHQTGYLYCQSQQAMMCVDLNKTTENFNAK